jgi:transposase
MPGKPATAMERLAAEADYMLGLSPRDIAKKTGRRSGTIDSWVKSGDWETKRRKAVERAAAKAEISTDKMMEENFKVLVEQRKILSKKLEKLKEQGDVNIPPKDVMALVNQTVATMAKLLEPKFQPVQVNVATTGPTAIQVIQGKPVAEMTNEELAAIIAEERKQIVEEAPKDAPPDAGGN